MTYYGCYIRMFVGLREIDFPFPSSLLSGMVPVAFPSFRFPCLSEWLPWSSNEPGKGSHYYGCMRQVPTPHRTTLTQGISSHSVDLLHWDPRS